MSHHPALMGRTRNSRGARGRSRSSGAAASGDTFAEVVLGLGPEFYFVLDQTGAEDPVDSSPSALVAQLNAPYTWGVAGPVGSLTALDLAGGYFTTARVALTGSQTRMAFVKTTSTDGPPPVYEGDAPLTILGDGTGSVWDSFGVSNGHVVYTRFNGSTWETFTGTAVVNDGAWHLLVATYDATDLGVTLYVDGVPDGSGTVTGPHAAQGGIDRYGRGYNAADNYTGALGHLAAWSRELTGPEVAALWASV
jgi:hypothetical protein